MRARYKKPVPSDAQAKLICRIFSGWREYTVYPGYIDSTTAACIKRGWLTPNGKFAPAPNGVPSSVHVISDDGLDALERWLTERRYKRISASGRGAMARREFSKETRRAALERAAGHCECRGAAYGLSAGQRCAMPLDRGVEFDHAIADSIGGEPTLENCVVACLRCHAFKSRHVDTPRAAKTKRQSDKDSGIRKRSTMPGSRNSRFKRKMDGTVVMR